MAVVSANGHLFDVSCIVFDKDGTLLDFDFTWGRKTATWIRALALAAPGYESQLEQISQAIGYDWKRQTVLADGPVAVTTALKLMTLAAGALYQQGLPWHEAEQLAAKTLRQTMGSPLQAAEIRPVGDVVGAFRRLKMGGLLLAVATGDNREPTRSTLSLLGIADDLAVVVCGDDPLPEKPDPAALFHIGDQTRISTSRMLMVGDSVNDMLTGRNANVAGCIGISGSSGDPEKLAAHADVVLPSIDQLRVIEPIRI